MALKTIEELKAHLNKYKDAVIIVGDKTVTRVLENGEKTNAYFQPGEDNKDIFNRKTMVKDPTIFWDFYKTIVLNNYNNNSPEEYEQIYSLIDLNLFKCLIDLNCDGLLSNVNTNYIPTKGNRYMLQCVKCREYINISDVNLENVSEVISHNDCKESDCKGKLRPSILFFNDKYDKDIISNMFKAIFKYDENDTPIGLNTHTLFLIGIDYEEDLIDEIIEGFNKFKYQDKGISIIIEPEEDDTMICAYKADFGTTYSIEGSIRKLIDILNNKEGVK